MGATQSQVPYVIPYEKQSQADGNRTCGAACLSMVYRSLGKEAPQEEIWEGIAKVNRFGSLASTTHLMVADAQKRGFDSVAIRARNPIFALRSCREAGVRVILNHRLRPDVLTGHYSVLEDIDEGEVTLHDPYLGPSRRISRGELMSLWEAGANSEITGRTLIAIAPPQSTSPPCKLCKSGVPAAVPCPNCGKAVNLRPSTAIGCIHQECNVRGWMEVCCPVCDYTWDFTTGAPAPAVGIQEEAEDQSPAAEINKAFARIDNLCAQLAAMPVAACNPQALKYIDALKGLRGTLIAAVAVHDGKHQAHLAKLEERLQESKAKKAAFEKKLAEINTPPPPLDGDTLVQALLNNVGFIKE